MDLYVAHNLPRPATSFLGREPELAQLAALLARPDLRLLTLCGPGGIGKTRLAVEAAARVAGHFADGTLLVELLPACTAAEVLALIAEALALPLTGATDPADQVLAALREKELLLLLDNAEQLGAAVELFSRLLRGAPGLTLLVTSREALQLQEEWLFPLDGLPWAADGGGDPVALRLFVERARQVRPDLDLAQERAAALAICRLVEGMPLALELAATWTRTLPCAAIAAELRRSLDLLASSLRNLPERHRSLRAVCDQSWALLDTVERSAFSRLAIFPAAFSSEAAAAVAGARLPLLDALIGRSLVRRAAGGRYQIHELLRQYGAERLAEDPGAAAGAATALGAYYAGLLSGWFTRCARGGITPEALAAIEPELESIGAHWGAILAASDDEALRGIALIMQNYYFVRGPYQQGADLIAAVLEAVRTRPATPERRLVEADCLHSLGWLNIRQGQIGAARRDFEASVAIYGQLGRPLPAGDGTEPLAGLGVIALIEGDYREASRLGAAARQRGEAEGHPGNQINGLYVLVRAAVAQGQLQAAQRYARQLEQIVAAAENRWFMAYCYIELGHIAEGLGDYGAAQTHYAAAFRLREEFADPEGMAVALAAQGGAALLAGSPEEAARRYEGSLAIYRYLGDQGGLAAALDGLGRAQLALGDHAAARQTLAEALRIATAMAYRPQQLEALVSVAELLAATGEQAQGLGLLRLVASHPAADREATRRAQALLIAASESSPPPAPGAGLVEEVDTLAAGALRSLASLAPGAPAVGGGAATARPAGLVEALSAREHEILGLIAAGRSNVEIAEELICSTGTVKWYTSQIYGKLGVKSRTQAVARARELGLLS